MCDREHDLNDALKASVPRPVDETGSQPDAAVDTAALAKRTMRAHLKSLRAALPRAERAAADAAIAARLFGSPEFRDADLIASYLSIGEEVDTHGIIGRAWQEGKTVALPRCAKGSRIMRWYSVTSLEGLERSPFGVLEPVADPDREVDLKRSPSSLALVPGLAFDMQGFRLGYGGGFYDTFLADFPGVSLGLCREAQLIESLDARGVVSAHDLPVDAVVTDRRMIAPTIA